MLGIVQKYLSHDSRCPGRDTNRAPPEHKSEALLLKPTSLAQNARVINIKVNGTCSKLHLLYELEYVIVCVGSLTEEKSCVCLNFPPAYEYRKYVESRIYNVLVMT
jgi:hypothetical protein